MASIIEPLKNEIGNGTLAPHHDEHAKLDKRDNFLISFQSRIKSSQHHR